MTSFVVSFENYQDVVVEEAFPSLAARIVGEQLGLLGDATCAVSEPDGTVTHWKVSLLKTWYARPAINIIDKSESRFLE